MLEKQLRQCGQDKDVLHSRLATLQADNDTLTQQLSAADGKTEHLRKRLCSPIDKRRSANEEGLSALRERLNSWK